MPERGPPGCNLFCFHLPNELTNYDLYLLFRKFGTILSVHTMINKNTGLSRGFGFVSFTTEDAAIAAVRAMDGFRLGKKRLKVQRKREHDGDFGVNFEDDFALMSHESEFGGGSGAGGTPGIFGMPSPYASGLISPPPSQGYSLSGGGGNITLRDIAPPNPYHQQQHLQAQLQHQQHHLQHAHAQQQQQQVPFVDPSFFVAPCCLLLTPICPCPSPLLCCSF